MLVQRESQKAVCQGHLEGRILLLCYYRRRAFRQDIDLLGTNVCHNWRLNPLPVHIAPVGEAVRDRQTDVHIVQASGYSLSLTSELVNMDNHLSFSCHDSLPNTQVCSTDCSSIDLGFQICDDKDVLGELKLMKWFLHL